MRARCRIPMPASSCSRYHVPTGVPPLILRLITTWRRLRSEGLLSDGTSGSATKTKSSLMWRSMRRHSRPCRANRSAMKGWQMASSCRSQTTSSGAPSSTASSMGERPGLDIELMDCRGPLGQRGVLVIELPSRSWMSRSRCAQHRCLGASVMVVGSVEPADQYSGE